MKKVKSRKRGSSTKSVGAAKRGSASRGKEPPKSVDEYFASVPEPARGALAKMRATIRSVVPAEATEVISYGIPAFQRTRVLVWYAAFSDHCSLFPTAAVIEQFKDELKGYSTSKGTIQFSLDRPLPLALIKKMTKARVAESGVKRRTGSA